jgi:hypothetical protein
VLERNEISSITAVALSDCRAVAAGAVVHPPLRGTIGLLGGGAATVGSDGFFR